jgi:hypothetical protein
MTLNGGDARQCGATSFPSPNLIARRGCGTQTLAVKRAFDEKAPMADHDQTYLVRAFWRSFLSSRSTSLRRKEERESSASNARIS